MKRSLHLKLSLIMLLTIILLIVVVSAFLTRGVETFYIEEFYGQMQAFFNDQEIASALLGTRGTAERTDYQLLADRLNVHSGRLGIVYGIRYYYVLDGATGAFLVGSETPDEGAFRITPNVLTALGGESGDRSDRQLGFMDVALPITTADGNAYIIQILDTKQTAADLAESLMAIIQRAAVIGLVISVFLSFVLSKTMVVPIQSLTRAAGAIAEGDFSRRIDSPAHDEIGELAATFNAMAGQLGESVAQLEQAAERQKEFVANVSHELRTPLTSVRSYAETLLDSPNLAENTRHDLLRVVVDESDRMTGIVQDLLTLAQLDSQRRSQPLETFSFQSAVERTVRTVALTAEEKGLCLDMNFPDEMPSMTGYRPGVEQIVLNIVSNAVKYTPPSGQVRLTAATDGQHITLTVADNGPGIPTEDLPRIFERFYRVEKGRSRETGGTGLGLGLAREMARQAGGDITLESVFGQGTTVTITLPLGTPLEDRDAVNQSE